MPIGGITVYQITMTICGKTIDGAVYGSIEEVTDALFELRQTAHDNNFPATYNFRILSE